MSMTLWFVRNVPSWLVAVLLIAGLPAVMLGLDRLIHRRMPHRRLGRHNEVTAAVVSTVGVFYGVMISLCVVWLWDGVTEVEETTRAEAANLAALVPASRVFDAATERRVAGAVIEYNTDLVRRWDLRREGHPNAQVTADLHRIVDTIRPLRPTTTAQQSFVEDAVVRLVRAQELRQQSLLEARRQQMSPALWFGVIGMTTMFLVLLLLFGLDDPVLRPSLIVLATGVVAINLFLIVQMNYPYYGTFAVGPDSYRDVLDDLRRTVA